MTDEAARFTAEQTVLDANLEVRELKHLLVVAKDKITKLEAENTELKKTIKPKIDWSKTPDVSKSEDKPRWFPPRKVESLGEKRGRETAEYLKSQGYMGGKKDKEEKSLQQKAIEASNRRSEIPTMDWQYDEPEDKSHLNADDEEPNNNSY